MKPVLLLQFLRHADERPIEVECFRTAGQFRPDELKVVHPLDEVVSPALLDEVRGVIVGGAGLTVRAQTPNEEAVHAFVRLAREKHVPMLGICFGAQLLAHVFGGQASYNPETSEHGTFDFALDDATDPLLAGLPMSFPIQCWHKARVTRLPEGARLLGHSARCPVQAFAFPGEKIWGTQFHPERTQEAFEKLLELRVAAQELTPEAAAEIRGTLRPSPAAASLVARFAKMTS